MICACRDGVYQAKLLCVFASLRENLSVQKLGKNHGGYQGEMIDIQKVLADIEAAAKKHGWASEVFFETQGLKLFALTRRAHRPSPLAHRLYISTGIHGNEPAGPLTALQLLQENNWPENAEIFLLPCLNPTGFKLNRRENADGKDLNRDYRNPQTAEVRAHIAWLEQQPKFDLTVQLHEDWESHGFYVYELNPKNSPSIAEKIIEAVANVCLIDRSELIEGRPAHNGIIRPITDQRSRPDWPEAFYLMTHKTHLSYTLEAPSDFPLETRVRALVAAVRAALENLK